MTNDAGTVSPYTGPTPSDQEITYLQDVSDLWGLILDQQRLLGKARCAALNYRQGRSDAQAVIDELVAALERIEGGERGRDGDVNADLNQAYHAQRIAKAVLQKVRNE